MPRYFLSLSYKGTAYSGFQAQANANTIQEEVSNAFRILQREAVILTGSSRTDTGVHAIQNFFHFDYDGLLNERFVYKMNAILPSDIVIHAIHPVLPQAHCRFDALSRKYKYFVYQQKNPFLQDRAYYFPYTLDKAVLDSCAALVMQCTNFTSFSKRNTQVKTFDCTIQESYWQYEGDCLVYNVKANRFLRGMVRALTATMLKVACGKATVEGFKEIIEAKDCTKASFDAPPHGLFLMHVEYPNL
jgi:tRNA pseudouridine38-40 synthase